MEYILTKHAVDVIAEREINPDWVEFVLQHPNYQLADDDDGSLTQYFARIADHGNRLLRVVVNTEAVPNRVVTCYFDRTKGKML
jgi:hypothetical protein